MSSTESPPDARSEQAKLAILNAARSILEESGSIDSVTLTKIAEQTHYATSVVHYHTGGIEPLKDELFQHLAIEFSFSMFLGEPDPLQEQPGHDVILAAGQWIKDHGASARFLASRPAKEVREPGLSGARDVFGLDLEADPDGLSVARFMHRSLFNPIELILDSEDGARTIDEESIVALGLLTWRHLRACLAILAGRPDGQGTLSALVIPRPGVVSAVPFRSPDAQPLDDAALRSARKALFAKGASAVPKEQQAAVHADISTELWTGVLERGAFDLEASDHLVSWITAKPQAARFLFFMPGLSGVPVDRSSLGMLVPGLCAADDQLEAVSFVLSRSIAGAAEIVPFIERSSHAAKVIHEALEGARNTLNAAGWVA